MIDPNRCPGCAAEISGATHCPSCGMLLRGPLAARLWQVDLEIDRLRDVRQSLVSALRPGGVGAAVASPPASVPLAPPVPFAPPAAPPPPPPYAWRPAPPKPRKEWTPQRVQNLLLATGALLLVVAAIAFTAFAWGRLPIAARGGIMLAVTGIAGWSARWVYRRGLTASAEAIALLTVLFAAVDAYAARRAGLARLNHTDPATYWTYASGVLAALSALYGRVLPVRSVRYAALVGAQLPLVLTAFRLDGLTPAERGAFLAANAAGLGVLAYRLGETRVAARVFGVVHWSVASMLALSTAFGSANETDVRIAALVLAATGAVALLWPGERAFTTGTATAFAVTAVTAVAAHELTFVQLPAAIAAAGLLAAVAAALAPRAWRAGPVTVGTGTVGVALLFVVPWVGQALVLPFSWLADPWRLTRDLPARAALAADGTHWGGSVVALAVVAVAAVTAVVTAEAFERRRAATWPVAAFGSVAVLLVPLGFASSYRVALAWYLVTGIAGLAAAAIWRRPVVAAPATVVLAVATGWSFANEGATLAVLLVVTLAYAGYAAADATLREAAAAVASTTACAFAVAFAVSRDAVPGQPGFVLATAACALMAAAALLGNRVRSVEIVAGVAYIVALPLSARDDAWLAATLSVGAFTAAASALRPSRRNLAAVSALLGIAATGTMAYARGAALDQTAFFTAVAACLAVGIGALLRGQTGDLVEGVAAAGYAVAVAIALPDVGWLSWILVAGAVTAAANAVRPSRRPLAAVAAALGVTATGTMAYSLGAPVDRTAFFTAVASCAAAGVAALLPGRTGELIEGVAATGYVVAVALALPDVGWLSWVLVIGTVTAGALAVRPGRRPLAAVAAGLGIAATGTMAYSLGAPLDRTAFYVALASCLAVGAAALLRGQTGDWIEAVAAVGYAIALPLALPDLGWISWILLAGGLTTMANALREERRWQHWLASALLTGWSWDRLWLADVTVPEAYAAPVAALTLALGHLRRRRDPSVGSWAAYGRGLGLAFGPTTVLVLTDPGVTRPVLLAVAALAVLLAGVSERLQAPLTVGALALSVDALVQLAPVAAALPKWATIGAAGLLVIAVGVTYEERRRDMSRLRETFDSLA